MRCYNLTKIFFSITRSDVQDDSIDTLEVNFSKHLVKVRALCVCNFFKWEKGAFYV